MSTVLQRAGRAAARMPAQFTQLWEKPAQALERPPSVVFMGPPGVGKGTYCNKLADALGIAHIATGDLVRDEIDKRTDVGLQAQANVISGNLIPDSMVFQLLERRLRQGRQAGEQGVLLDGFPRTVKQAEALLHFSDVQLAVNLSIDLRVLVDKCLGRRLCMHCKKNYNIADIHIPAQGDRPEIRMPPLPAPQECQPHLIQRTDDNVDTVLHRVKVYEDEATPVERFFRERGLLLDFEITGGIPETLPRLRSTLEPYVGGLKRPAAS